jgi:hypothetical protein
VGCSSNIMMLISAGSGKASSPESSQQISTRNFHGLQSSVCYYAVELSF